MSRLQTLRARVTVWTMLVNLVLLIVLGFGSGLMIWRLQRRQIDETLQLSTAQLMTAVDITDGQLNLPEGDAAVLNERGAFAWAMDASGRLIATVGRASGIAAPRLVDNTYSDFQIAPNEQARVYQRALSGGSGRVIVGVSLNPLALTLRRFALAAALITPLVLGLSALGGLFLAGRALSPIARITAQARQIGHDNLAERLALGGPRDEVRELAQTFDEMLNRLQSAFESQALAHGLHMLGAGGGVKAQGMSALITIAPLFEGGWAAHRQPADARSSSL